MPDMSHARDRMAEAQIASRGVRDRAVLAAMRAVPREEFVEAGYREFAYDDAPLPIGQGQTISQPYVVALMIEAAKLKPSDTVLEVGAGCGYAAAVMSRIARSVYGVERRAELGEAARARLARLGYGNVEIRIGDGTLGWVEAAPFDAIVVSVGGPSAPPALKQQLGPGGRLIIPVGDDPHSQRLLRITRLGASEFKDEDLGAVMFVPLVGEQGWTEEDRPAPTV